MNEMHRESKKKIEVCCCVIIHNSQILILRRNHRGLRNGLWEFPGGKLEDETLKECAEREVYEEINIRVGNLKFLCSVESEYEDISIKLNAFISFSDLLFSPSLKVHSEYRWVSSSQLNKFTFPKANLEIIDIIIKNGY